MDSERPANLDALALEQYELLLEEQIFPFEEKAIELFETNANRAAEGIWDEWVEKSYAELASLMPARYAKREQGEDVVTALFEQRLNRWLAIVMVLAMTGVVPPVRQKTILRRPQKVMRRRWSCHPRR